VRQKRWFFARVQEILVKNMNGAEIAIRDGA